MIEISAVALGYICIHVGIFAKTLAHITKADSLAHGLLDIGAYGLALTGLLLVLG